MRTQSNVLAEMLDPPDSPDLPACYLPRPPYPSDPIDIPHRRNITERLVSNLNGETGYEKATYGRTFHVSHIDVYRVDKHPPPLVKETLEGNGGVGTWRLPSDRYECASVLWGLWCMPHFMDPDENMKNKYGEKGVSNRYLQRAVRDHLYEKRCKEAHSLQTMVTAQEAAAEKGYMTLDTDQDLFPSDPMSMTRSSTEWIHLRSKELIASCLVAIAFAEDLLYDQGFLDSRSVSSLELLKEKQRKREIQSLDTSIYLAEIGKGVGAESYGLEDYASAANAYIQGLCALAPWYPSEWYMSSWEGKLTGLTDITLGLMMNLGLAIKKLGGYRASTECFGVVFRHPFVDNRLAAKAWYAFAECTYLSSRSDRVDIAIFVPTPDGRYFYERYRKAKAQYTIHSLLPPDKLARQSEVGDFSPGFILNSAIEIGDLDLKKPKYERLLSNSVLHRQKECIVELDLEEIDFEVEVEVDTDTETETLDGGVVDDLINEFDLDGDDDPESIQDEGAIRWMIGGRPCDLQWSTETTTSTTRIDTYPPSWESDQGVYTHSVPIQAPSHQIGVPIYGWSPFPLSIQHQLSQADDSPSQVEPNDMGSSQQPEPFQLDIVETSRKGKEKMTFTSISRDPLETIGEEDDREEVEHVVNPIDS